MASEKSNPLRDETQPVSSKPKKSSEKKHTSGNFRSPTSSKITSGKLPSYKMSSESSEKIIKEEIPFQELWDSLLRNENERLEREDTKHSNVQAGRDMMTWRLDLQVLQIRLETLPLRKQHTIYRLPNNWPKQPYFTPRAVSIGPYHYGKTLPEVVDHKARFLKDFMCRNPRNSVEQCLYELERMEPKIRKYYAENLNFTSDKFITMMLLDGCFILESLIKFYDKKSDEIFSNDFSQYIKTDLLMFANQIPFMVLVKLHELANTGSLPCFDQLLVNYFWDTTDCQLTLRTSASHNILNFYHLQFVPPFVNECLKNKSPKKKYCAELNKRFIKWGPSAGHLEKAGVRFSRKRTMNFLDIKFQNGVVEIPILSMDEPFLLLLVNLAMFEEHNIAVGKVVQIYCFFMYCLLDKPSDIRLLREKGIIVGNSISDEEFHDQLRHFKNHDYWNSEKHYFANLFVDLLEYCEKGEKIGNVQEMNVKYYFFFKAFVIVVVVILSWVKYYL